jgi:hypothetical protein
VSKKAIMTNNAVEKILAASEHGLAKRKRPPATSSDLYEMPPQVGLEPTTLRFTEVPSIYHRVPWNHIEALSPQSLPSNSRALYRPVYLGVIPCVQNRLRHKARHKFSFYR